MGSGRWRIRSAPSSATIDELRAVVKSLLARFATRLRVTDRWGCRYRGPCFRRIARNAAGARALRRQERGGDPQHDVAPDGFPPSGGGLGIGGWGQSPPWRNRTLANRDRLIISAGPAFTS